MRGEGVRYTAGATVNWTKGSAEATGLPSAKFAWVTMASAFHWANAARALPEFKRILVPGGSFTALWNPRDIKTHPLHVRIEKIIQDEVPNLKRRSSGMGDFTDRLPELLISTGDFEDVHFVEEKYVTEVSVDRYMGAWRSVNDIQVQSGPMKFALILEKIEKELNGMKTVQVPYRTRAWTARVR